MPYFRYVGDHADYVTKGEGENAVSVPVAPGDYVELSKAEADASYLTLIPAEKSDLPKEEVEDKT